MGLLWTACAPLLREPDHRRLVWEYAKAEMLLSRSHQGYASLWIDLERTDRDWTIRMPDGRWLRTDAIHPGVIESDRAPVLDEAGPGNRRRASVLFDRGECASAFGFIAGSIVFEFEGHRLVALGLTGNLSFPEPCRPALGSAERDRLHSMPMDEVQLVELLGPYVRREEYYGGL